MCHALQQKESHLYEKNKLYDNKIEKREKQKDFEREREKLHILYGKYLINNK